MENLTFFSSDAKKFSEVVSCDIPPSCVKDGIVAINQLYHSFSFYFYISLIILCIISLIREYYFFKAVELKDAEFIVYNFITSFCYIIVLIYSLYMLIYS